MTYCIWLGCYRCTRYYCYFVYVVNNVREFLLRLQYFKGNTFQPVLKHCWQRYVICHACGICLGATKRQVWLTSINLEVHPNCYLLGFYHALILLLCILRFLHMRIRHANKISRLLNALIVGFQTLKPLPVTCGERFFFFFQTCDQVLALGAIWLLPRWKQCVRTDWTVYPN